MKPLIVISIIGYIGWLFQYDAHKKAVQTYKRNLAAASQQANAFGRDNYVVGVKVGYILKTKNGTKDDIDKVIAEWPQINYITQFTTK